MRPPSYYNSLVNSNTSNRNSSQQLRSSFSSSSSSSYVSRTHLPFVAQSTLVAHCFTGVQSSTRPYGASTGHSNAGSSGSYLSARSSYTTSSYSSRPASTKRPTSTTPSSSSSSYLSSSSLASGYSYGSSTRYTPTSSYRPVTSSSYYKPIRLRERPLLTQISRQLDSRSPASKSVTPTHSAARSRAESQVSSSETVKVDSPVERAKQSETIEETREDEASWSADVARNISRNKYLIKFRELDKRHSLVSPDEQELEKSRGTEPVGEQAGEGTRLKVSEKLEEESRETRRVENLEESEMRIPKLDQDVPTQVKLAEKKPPSEKLKAKKTSEVKEINKTQPIEDCDKIDQGQTVKPTTGTTSTKRKVPAKRNIKLRIKTQTPAAVTQIQSAPTAPSTTTAATSTTTTTEAPDIRSSNTTSSIKSKTIGASVRTKQEKPADEKPPTPGTPEKVPTSPKILKKKASGEKKPAEPGSPSTKTKVKRLVKTSKTKAAVPSESGANKKSDQLGAATSSSEPPERQVLASKQNIQDKPLPPEPQGTAQEKSSPVVSAAQLPPSGNGPPQTSATGNKRIRFRQYNIEDFNFLSVLGHGGWGFVILAELKDHDACFAVKCIKKITIVEDDDFDSIMIERKVLTLGNIHPFICKLFCTFETPGYLFFVMEYCAGGDLMFHVQHEGQFTESRCRFYAAEIICAIRFLHNRHIIYRDLKLDNILLDSLGHVRLVDFGMCQCRTYREEMLPSNFCGTPGEQSIVFFSSLAPLYLLLLPLHSFK